MNNKQHLAKLAKRVERELGTVTRAIEEFEFDMDAVTEEVLDAIELDGREITCNSTPDAPDIDIDTEALEGELGSLILAIDAMPEDGEAVTGFQLSEADVKRITRALSDARARLYDMALEAEQVAKKLGTANPIEVNQFGQSIVHTYGANPFADALHVETDALDALATKLLDQQEHLNREASMS